MNIPVDYLNITEENQKEKRDTEVLYTFSQTDVIKRI